MKKIRISSALMIAVLIGLVILFSSHATAEFKKTKIAVLDFQQQGEEFQTKDMGKIVSEWLITGLVESGRFDVIERRLLEKILEEHKLGMTGIIDQESVAQLGKVLGVRTVVTGTILNFERVVEINARLISVDTGSIIAAEKVQAPSATRLNDLVSQIVDKIMQAFPLEGYVVQRTDNTVTIDLGAKLGVKLGMGFIAFKEGKVIKHPKTGEVLDVEIIELGEIKIKDVREKTSTGDIVKESSPKVIDYGSMVRSAVKGLIRTEEETRDKTQEPKRGPKPSDGKGKTAIPLPGF